MFEFRPGVPRDAVLKDIGVDERLGAQAPPGLRFTDQDGRIVALGDYFGHGPVILTLNYYECPMLCPTTFKNLVSTMDAMKGLRPGRDYRVVTVSVNPDERASDVSSKADEVYNMMKTTPAPREAWAFLYGAEPEIGSLTRAVGYRYKKVENGFAHPAVIMVLTPDGRVSRYLYGIEFDPMDVRLALIEASGGKVGGSKVLNRALLFCYHYDPKGRKYAVAAMRLMKALGVATIIFLGLLAVYLWRAAPAA